MAEASSVGLAEQMLRQILDAWLRRDERTAAKTAGSLTFWRDGMLEHLRTIERGEATAATFKALKKELKATKEPVERSMQKLREVRDKLGGSKISRQIDIILNDDRIGKSSIREFIDGIIRSREGKSHSYLYSDFDFDPAGGSDIHQARLVCQAIESLNAEIGRLHRMVNPE